MSDAPVYVRRFNRVTRTLNLLSMHANGMPIRQLADSLGVDVKRLREELRAYFNADVPYPFKASVVRQTTIEFHDADGEDADPADAEYVLSAPHPTAEIGADYASLAELAQIYRAGQDLLAVEPENSALEGALEALQGTTLQGIGVRRSTWLADLVAKVGEAMRARREVRVVYARAWQPGVREHVVEPYRLTKTRRGWELDGGLGDGRVGTFLLSGIRSVDLLESTFERPADVDSRIAANRRTVAVDVVVPQDSRWVVERFAESVTVVHEDEGEVRLRAQLLAPVEQRLGLLLLVAGASTFVLTPTQLRDVGVDLARELLNHHAS